MARSLTAGQEKSSDEHVQLVGMAEMKATPEMIEAAAEKLADLDAEAFGERGDGYLYLDNAREVLNAALSASPAPAVPVEPVVKPPFEFDRYINGELMAEGVTIELQTTVERAARAAARIASRGKNGEVPVLVLRATPPAPAAGDDKCLVCNEPLKAEDICSTDIELGICHAACLEGSPTVDLQTGEPLEGLKDTYRYGDIDDLELDGLLQRVDVISQMYSDIAPAPPVPSVGEGGSEHQAFTEWWGQRRYSDYPEHYPLITENGMFAAWCASAARFSTDLREENGSPRGAYAKSMRVRAETAEARLAEERSLFDALKQDCNHHYARATTAEEQLEKAREALETHISHTLSLERAISEKDPLPEVLIRTRDLLDAQRATLQELEGRG